MLKPAFSLLFSALVCLLLMSPHHALQARTTFGTALNIYDAQGVASPVNLYFERTPAAAAVPPAPPVATPNSWDVYTGLKDVPSVGDNATPWGTITFDSTSGNITKFTAGAAVPAAAPAGTGVAV